MFSTNRYINLHQSVLISYASYANKYNLCPRDTLASSTDSVTEFSDRNQAASEKPIQASLDLFFIFLISSGLWPTGGSHPGQVVIHCCHFHPSEQSYCDNDNDVNGHHDENDNDDDADEGDDDYNSYKTKRLWSCLILKPSLKSQHDTSLHDTAAKYLWSRYL